jgi:hypothetical protein
MKKKLKNNNNTLLNQTYTYIPKRKNGIADNILSLEQDMKRRGAEHNVNEEARGNMSKSDVLERRKEKQ